MCDEVLEVLLFLAVLFVSEIAAQQPPIIEWLCSLRTSANADAWPNNWCTDTDVCHWHGVLCAPSQTVVGVSLVSVPLNAAIGKALYAPGVTKLALRNCSLTGAIEKPLAGVTTLDLANNKISGALPASFFANVLSVDLSHNELSSVGDMCTNSAPVKLDLSFNKFVDDLTPCAKAGKLFAYKLTTLRLNDNAFSGVAPFPSCAHVYNVANNRFNDVADPRPLEWQHQQIVRPSFTTDGKVARTKSEPQPSLVACDMSGNAASGAKWPLWVEEIAADDMDAFVAKLCKQK